MDTWYFKSVFKKLYILVFYTNNTNKFKKFNHIKYVKSFCIRSNYIKDN